MLTPKEITTFKGLHTRLNEQSLEWNVAQTSDNLITAPNGLESSRGFSRTEAFPTPTNTKTQDLGQYSFKNKLGEVYHVRWIRTDEESASDEFHIVRESDGESHKASLNRHSPIVNENPNRQFGFIEYTNTVGEYLLMVSWDKFCILNKTTPLADPADLSTASNNTQDFTNILFIKNGRLLTGEDSLLGSWIDKSDGVGAAFSVEEYTETVNLTQIAGTDNYSVTLDDQNLDGVTLVDVELEQASGDGFPADSRRRNGNFDNVGTVNYNSREIIITDIDSFRSTTDTTESDGVSDITAVDFTATYTFYKPADKGIADFTFDLTDRQKETGFAIPLTEGRGELKGIKELNNTLFIFKEDFTYTLRISIEDKPILEPFRQELGLQSRNALLGVGSGIIFMNTARTSQPVLMSLQRNIDGDAIEPNVFNSAFDFAPYDFSQAQLLSDGDYIIVNCKTPDSIVNNKIILYSRLTEQTDVITKENLGLKILDGNLYLYTADGDILQALDGFSDEDDDALEGERILVRTNFNSSQQKRVRRALVEGYISQGMKVTLFYRINGKDVDEATFDLTSLNTISRDETLTIGGLIGESTIGGAGAETVEATKFSKLFNLDTPRFDTIQWGIRYSGIGYFRITRILLTDIYTFPQKRF